MTYNNDALRYSIELGPAGNMILRQAFEQPERMVTLLIQGLRGSGDVLRFDTPYTGLSMKCPLCLKPTLHLLLAHHIMKLCTCPRVVSETVIIVAPDSEPEPHWEKD